MLNRYLAISALLLATVTNGLHIHKSMGNLYKRHNATAARHYHLNLQSDGVVLPQELFIDMPIDHITTNGSMEIYKMRYILDDSNVDPKGIQYPPILFYCGNEADIWTFYNNTGFMT